MEGVGQGQGQDRPRRGGQVMSKNRKGRKNSGFYIGGSGKVGVL
jgi:hypothetical protein